jgi:hypothetical protein
MELVRDADVKEALDALARHLRQVLLRTASRSGGGGSMEHGRVLADSRGEGHDRHGQQLRQPGCHHT